MQPSHTGIEKVLKEYDPPLIPLRYLIYDSLVFLSGVTAILPTLEEQLSNILPRISATLVDAGTSWERVAKISCYLHRSQNLDKVRASFQKAIKTDIPQFEYGFVDGYSNPGKLVEVEVTASIETAWSYYQAHNPI